MKNIFKWAKQGAQSAGLALAAHAAVFAANNPDVGDILPNATEINTGSFDNDIDKTITFLFNFIITIAGIVFVILLIVGGIMYLTSAGNEEQTGKAKKLLIDSIIGLVLVLSAWAIGRFILGSFGYNL